MMIQIIGQVAWYKEDDGRVATYGEALFLNYEDGDMQVWDLSRDGEMGTVADAENFVGIYPVGVTPEADAT